MEVLYELVDTTTIPPRVVVSSPTVDGLLRDLEELEDRVLSLEAKRFTATPIKVASYVAVAWDHVLVDLGGLLADVTITMPASPTVGDRVRATDISTDGGYGNSRSLKVAATFVTATGGGYWASSPHSVAYSAGDGGSSKGASKRA